MTRIDMWVFWILLAALFNAVYYLVMQNIKLQGNVFMVLKGIVSFCVLCPVFLIYPVLLPVGFYVVSCIQGGVIAYSDYLFYRANKIHGAEIVASVMPFSVIISFLGYCLLVPEFVENLLSRPVHAIGVCVSVSGVAWAMMNYRKSCSIKSAFFLLFPGLFLSASTALLSKFIMTYSGDDVWVAACQRIGVVSIVSGLVHLFICGKKQVPWHDVFKKSTLIKSTIFLLLISVAILKGVAFKYAANPAYVSCLLYTSFLWITILPHFIPVFKFKNACNQVYHRKWEYLFIFFVILLILSTQT